MKKIISLILAYTLLFTSVSPLAAQVPTDVQYDVVKMQGELKAPSLFNSDFFTLKESKDARIKFTRKFLDPNYLNPITDKEYAKHSIEFAWRNYKESLKDKTISSNPDVRLTPYQMMQEMSLQAREIGKHLKQSKRYKSEQRKAEWLGYGESALKGIVAGLVIVFLAPYALAAGGSGALSCLGGTATTSLAASTASYSTVKVISVVAFAELFATLVPELLAGVYKSLTKNLTKYQKLANVTFTNHLLQSLISEGSIINEETIMGFGDSSCFAGDDSKEIRPNTQWKNYLALREATIRLAALKVIRAEITYSTDPVKYDLALLDILNIFSDQEAVFFDEEVFTIRYNDENGIGRTLNNTNIVLLGEGRLMERSAELMTALKAINDM